MQTRSFGNTSKAISRIGLGLAALGRPGYINLGHGQDITNTNRDAMENQTHQILDAAWGAGIRYFDAARSYGAAEDFLANWLTSRNIDPKAVVIGSKWGYAYTANWQIDAEHHEIKSHSLNRLNQQWNETQDRLGAYLDLYQIHSATFQSGVLENKDVLNRLAQLKANGTLIGLSLSGTQQAEMLDAALTINIDGQRLFDAVQATWNILEPSAGHSLQHAHDQGLGVILKEVLANGRLTSRNTKPQFKDQHQRLSNIAQRLGGSIDAVAIAAALHQPFADVVLSGAAQLSHLNSNLNALTLPWDTEAQNAIQSLQESPDSYWQTRSSLAWN